MTYKKHFLYPGNIYALSQPSEIMTILGSCVSICLYDKKKRIGGINHYMLPFWNGEGLATPRYGNIAIEKLYDKMLKMGSNPRDLVAKMFGGGAVIESKSSKFDIGRRNIEIGLEELERLNLKIVSKDFGGKLGRKLKFNSETGVVLMKRIKKTNCKIKKGK